MWSARTTPPAVSSVHPRAAIRCPRGQDRPGAARRIRTRRRTAGRPTRAHGRVRQRHTRSRRRSRLRRGRRLSTGPGHRPAVAGSDCRGRPCRRASGRGISRCSLRIWWRWPVSCPARSRCWRLDPDDRCVDAAGHRKGQREFGAERAQRDRGHRQRQIRGDRQSRPGHRGELRRRASPGRRPPASRRRDQLRGSASEGADADRRPALRRQPARRQCGGAAGRCSRPAP